MISLNELIATFRQKKLQIDCRSITLVQNAAEKPVTYSGKGYIRQNDDDTLSLKLYGTETLNTDMFASFKREAGGVPGELYAESAYFGMTAVSVDNDTWTSDRILPHGSWDARDPNPVVHASLSLLVKDHAAVSDDRSLTLHYFEEADIPRMIDRMTFKAADADFEIIKGDGEFTVAVRSAQDLPEQLHTRVEESLRFLLAQSVAWRVCVLNSGQRYRVELAAARPRSRRVLLDPPIYRGSHGFLEDSWRLFGLYLDYVLRTTPYPHWNILSYYIHNACEASANSLDAWATLPEDYNVTYDEMKAAFDNGNFKLVLENNALVSLELEMLDHVMPLLFRRGWHLLRAPEGSGGFITADRPFYLIWSDPAMRTGPHAPGLALAGTDIYFPISPTLAVVGAFNVGNTLEDVDEARVALANSAVIDGAARQVYAPHHNFFYARTLTEKPRRGGQLISDKRFPRKCQ